MSERTEFMNAWNYKWASNLEVWHVVVDGSPYSDYYFPEEEDLKKLLGEITEDVETVDRKVSSSYVQPDNHLIKLVTMLRDGRDAEWWTL